MDRISYKLEFTTWVIHVLINFTSCLVNVIRKLVHIPKQTPEKLTVSLCILENKSQWLVRVRAENDPNSSFLNELEYPSLSAFLVFFVVLK
mmetsp:Transcript_11013/g.16849  ORF Transcript_11013/g.16849 Transcript_11013/m.16849 type:complete len:91 (-) Transcript_11013:261-533(-)